MANESEEANKKKQIAAAINSLSFDAASKILGQIPAAVSLHENLERQELLMNQAFAKSYLTAQNAVNQSKSNSIDKAKDHYKSTTLLSNSLEITGIKAIRSKAILQNLDRVNYLVGKNGHGKSSVLSALSYLGDVASEMKFMRPGSSVIFRDETRDRSCEWNTVEKKATQLGDMHIRVVAPLISNERYEWAHECYRADSNPIKHIGEDGFKKLSKTLKFFDARSIEAKRIPNSNPWSSEPGEMVFMESGENPISLPFISQGIQALDFLREFIWSGVDIAINHGGSGIPADKTFIIMEEPENDLHPGIHKILPQLIDDMLGTVSESVRKQIHFIISTHSPFLISSSGSHEGHKTYLFNDGKLVDLDMKEVDSSDGFSGHQCAWVVGQMLGGEVTDLGYPENYGILEEYSLQVILDSCKTKEIIKNIQFVSAGGAARQAGFAETIKELRNWDTLTKCNPYYYDKYLFIVDNMHVNTISKDLRDKTGDIQKRLCTLPFK